MAPSNDERGWIMTCLSAVACMFGASIICIDIIVRQFPGQKHFKIQDSDTFLSFSLSLSFGVMLFSALYSMLPSAKQSLQDGGFSSKDASWILVACFVGGVVGIQIISQVLHHFMPSQVVDCEHNHESDSFAKQDGPAHAHSHDHNHHVQSQSPQKPDIASRKPSRTPYRVRAQNNRRPQAPRSATYSSLPDNDSSVTEANMNSNKPITMNPQDSHSLSRTSSFQTFINAGVSQLVSVKKAMCDANGSCYGYSEVCGKECFKIVSARGGFKTDPEQVLHRPAMVKSATVTESTPLLHDIDEEPQLRPHTQAGAEGAASLRQEQTFLELVHSENEPMSMATNGHAPNGHPKADAHDTHTNDQPDHRHHHHVPTNAFLSIGLQTSIAIALHKLPEGFITYATNHANPDLGVSVFVALFIHNISEGFALALPLYLAMNNRVKAMLISFVLGGLSQPMGAGVAAIWLKVAGTGQWAPSDAVYGGMFAVISGIMASVGLQLFSESLDLTHSKNLCMVGAFTGMMVLAISSALTA